MIQSAILLGVCWWVCVCGGEGTAIEVGHHGILFVSCFFFGWCVLSSAYLAFIPLFLVTESLLLWVIILAAIILGLWYREARADELDDRYDCGFIYDQDATLTLTGGVDEGESRILVVGWLAVDLIVTVNFFLT